MIDNPPATGTKPELTTFKIEPNDDGTRDRSSSTQTPRRTSNAISKRSKDFHEVSGRSPYKPQAPRKRAKTQKSVKSKNQPPLTGKLADLFRKAFEDLEAFGPMKLKQFVKSYSKKLLDRMLQSRDVKLRESHLGTVVVLNRYKYSQCYETYYTANTLTACLILRAALERYCATDDTCLISRSNTSAVIMRDNFRTLVLARLVHQKTRYLQLLLDRLETPKPEAVIVVVPKKHKNFFGKIPDYQINILELGPSFAPVYNQRRR